MRPRLPDVVSRVVVVGVLVGIAVSPTSPARLHAEGTSWTVSNAKVVVNCPLTVGGSFDASTTALTGTLSTASAEPGALGGELIVDLRTLDTGISLRNTHMRDNYLQVQQPGYDRAILSAIRSAVVTDSNDRSDFTARLTLHGVTRELAGQVRRRARGATLQIDASFPLRLADFDIPEPRYLGIGVRNEVSVRVTFTAVPAGGPRK
jgi:polyisoprenoid-binding protein YceI